MSRRPPRVTLTSTLFPHTRLFRSGVAAFLIIETSPDAGSLADISGISERRGWANAAIFVDEEARLGKTAIEAHRLFGGDVQCTGDAFGRLVGARRAHDLNSLDELGRKPVDEKGAIGLAARCAAAVDQHLGKAGRKATHLRSEEHTSELPSQMRRSYAVLLLQKKKNKTTR